MRRLCQPRLQLLFYGEHCDLVLWSYASQSALLILLTLRLCSACLQATPDVDEAAVVAKEADIATDQALCDKHADE